MKPRNIWILLAAVILLTIAPVAIADPCQRCVGSGTNPQCINVGPHSQGTDLCIIFNFFCFDNGSPCGGEGVSALASEYEVVSVERADGPKQPAEAPLVAPAEGESFPHPR